jgi:hypothetical protein
MIWKLVFVTAFCGSVMCSHITMAVPLDDIAGNYLFEGDADDGERYDGTLNIQIVGETYELRWKTSAGQEYFGVGIRTGEFVAVGIREPQNTEYTAVILYRVEPGPKLVGKWAMHTDSGKVRDETAFKVK